MYMDEDRQGERVKEESSKEHRPTISSYFPSTAFASSRIVSFIIPF